MAVATAAPHQTIHVRSWHLPPETPDIPILENGDHLTREEFERRYHAMPNIKKAELIEGRVYMSSPVRRTHGKSHAEIMTWLGYYSASTPGIDLNDNVTVRLDKKNEPQPDAALLIISKTIGTSRVSSDDYIEGAPELIVEVAVSSASYDLHEKRRVYERSGVQEYVVWQVYGNRLDWFQLRDKKYIPLLPDADGVIRSQVFPGLSLAVEELLSGDIATVLDILQQGLHTPEHAAFVERITQL